MKKTWANIKTFDDIILPEERIIISNLEKYLEIKCPCLKKQEEFFYYCGLNNPATNNMKPAPFNPIYQRHVGLIELQLYCMKDFETCCFYSGKIKR